MPSLGAPELLIILAVVIIVFGVGKLPEVGGALGKGIKEFRRSAREGSDDKPAEAAPPASGAGSNAAPAEDHAEQGTEAAAEAAEPAAEAAEPAAAELVEKKS